MGDSGKKGKGRYITMEKEVRSLTMKGSHPISSTVPHSVSYTRFCTKQTKLSKLIFGFQFSFRRAMTETKQNTKTQQYDHDN